MFLQIRIFKKKKNYIKNLGIYTGLTWCIPCVTITKGRDSNSPTESSVESSESQTTSESTVIKKTTTTTSTLQTVIQHRRSASVSSNCSHALQCTTSDTESGGFKSKKSGSVRPCIKHGSKTGLSQSYDDLLSATTSNSSVNSGTYGFVRKPVLKRSNSSVSTNRNSGFKTGYSTNSLCSNKSVKFKLPEPKVPALPEHSGSQKISYYFGQSGIPVMTSHQTGSQSYFVCQNYCGACGSCPFTQNFYPQNPNFQYAWIQAQNFFNYHQQLTNQQLESTG